MRDRSSAVAFLPRKGSAGLVSARLGAEDRLGSFRSPRAATKVCGPADEGLMADDDVKKKLKEIIISELNLEGKQPDDIDDAAPLFGEGLGLDSLDALQLAMAVEENFGVQVPEGDEARPIFASVDALAAHIVKQTG
jgi:acyl carrier protein